MALVTHEAVIQKYKIKGVGMKEKSNVGNNVPNPTFGATVVGPRLLPCEGEDREKSRMNEFLGMETLSKPSYRGQRSGSFGNSRFAEVVER